jgi:hypothetical protein
VRSLEAVAEGFESTRHQVLGGVLVGQRTGVISHHKTRRVGYRRSLLTLLLRTGLLERVSGLGQANRSRNGNGDGDEDEPQAQHDEGREVIGAAAKDGPA